MNKLISSLAIIITSMLVVNASIGSSKTTEKMDDSKTIKHTKIKPVVPTYNSKDKNTMTSSEQRAKEAEASLIH